MATDFTLHEFKVESDDESDDFGVLPVYDYTDWTFDLTVARRAGTNPTLDLTIQEAPVDDDDRYEDLVSFTQVDQNTSLPDEQTKEGGGTDYTMPAGARFVRIDQVIGGTDPEWWYLLTATVTLFDVGTADHLALMEDRYDDHPDLADIAELAEDEVVGRYRGPDGLLTLDDDSELTGRALREAIARRIEWKIRRRELENSTKAQDGPKLRNHMREQWWQVDGALSGEDTREPLYMI